jgi:hypothetical protein
MAARRPASLGQSRAPRQCNESWILNGTRQSVSFSGSTEAREHIALLKAVRDKPLADRR